MAKLSCFPNQRFGAWRKAVLTLLFIFAATLAMPQVIFAGPPQPLYVMDTDGTNLRKLTHLHEHECMGSPIYTRDGKHILFDAWRKDGTSQTCHTYQVNADGTWPQDLGPGAMPTRNSRKDNGIVTHYYGSRQGIWLGMKEPTLIDQDAGSPRWHPHEPKIAYVKWTGGIAMREITFNGAELNIGEEEMVVPAKHAPYVGFSWSPDGKGIAFYSNRNGNDKSELLVMNVTDPENEPVLKSSGKIGWILSWSPDGTKVAFSNYCEETKTRQVYLVDPGSTEPPYLMKGQDSKRHNGGPAWSPDGKQIVFTSTEVAKKKAAPVKAEEEKEKEAKAE